MKKIDWHFLINDPVQPLRWYDLEEIRRYLSGSLPRCIRFRVTLDEGQSNIAVAYHITPQLWRRPTVLAGLRELSKFLAATGRMGLNRDHMSYFWWVLCLENVHDGNIKHVHVMTQLPSSLLVAKRDGAENFLFLSLMTNEFWMWFYTRFGLSTNLN
jgi:hypothetical protein